MKYLFSLLLTIIFIGAGCTKTSDTDVQVQKQVTTTPSTTETAPVPEIEITTDTGTVVVTQNTTTETEESIPVTEITLGTTSDTTMNMEAGNYFFTPNTFTVAPGSTVKVTFQKNNGFHTFVIDEINLNFNINEGESVIFTAPSEPGSYPFYCNVGSHRSSGMEGTLIVN